MLVLEQLRQWQSEDSDAPAGWRAAWERALDLLGPAWPTEEMRPGTEVLADGGAALTMALYIVSREQGIAPADVSRAQVGDLIDRQGETDTEIPPRWESRLRALGHDPEAPGDPVSARWRDLRKDNSPPDSAPDAVHVDHGSEYRWGPGFLEGLRSVLAPLYETRLQF
ncbi:hypothetical protein [Streptomyces sp. PVA_94-07]|uniref:hypothetical protein n=1 Tax=Streptomyces sp. PVA_94-07 TaxID=1225337 RepID=UPI000ABAFECA|nr:hypothetical protein [Streptomyces sp. PVA_94-07]